MENSHKTDCCSSSHCSEENDSCKTVKNIDDPVTISMIASGAILIAGFLMVAFVSGPMGLVLSLLALSALGLYYAIKGG